MAKLLRMVFVELATNAVRHGAVKPVPPIVGVARDPGGGEITIVMWNDASVTTTSGSSAGPLRDALRQSRENLGGIDSIARLLDRRGVLAAARLAVGDSRASFTSRGWRVTDAAPHVPGWLVVYKLREQGT